MDRAKQRILVVDDEKPLNRALYLKLAHEGYEADTAYDGEEALSLIDKNNYSLILLDLIMPKMDGFAVLQKIKEKGNAPPVIVLTNLGQPDDQKRAMEMGAVGFFIKSDTQLSEIIAEIKNKLAKG